MSPGRQRRRRHLIEQRLKDVVVMAIDHGHVHVGGRERAGGVQPAKSAADDDDARPAIHLIHEKPDSRRGE